MLYKVIATNAMNDACCRLVNAETGELTSVNLWLDGSNQDDEDEHRGEKGKKGSKDGENDQRDGDSTSLEQTGENEGDNADSQSENDSQADNAQDNPSTQN